MNLAVWYVQVRAKLDTSSEEGESPKTMMVSDVKGFSSASSWDEIATQRSNSTPRNCTEVCIISLPACLPGKSLYGGTWETTAKKERPSTWSWPQKMPKVNGSTLGKQAKRWIKAIDTGWFLLPSFFLMQLRSDISFFRRKVSPTFISQKKYKHEVQRLGAPASN